MSGLPWAAYSLTAAPSPEAAAFLAMLRPGAAPRGYEPERFGWLSAYGATRCRSCGSGVRIGQACRSCSGGPR
jgi:hypothetical protein